MSLFSFRFSFQKSPRTQPQFYPDTNHKPELAVPLGDFTCYVGLQTNEQIVELLTSLPLLYVCLPNPLYSYSILIESFDIIRIFSSDGNR